jgi:hypothetical protein
MKLQITIEYQSGNAETYTAQPPEFAKWENKTGFIVSQMQDKIGISDLLFLAYHAMKRQSGGKPVKPFDVWCDTVTEVKVGDEESPKDTPSEV